LKPQQVFDTPHYRALDVARAELLREALGEFQAQLDLQTAWDIGCGVGNFSVLLKELGFQTRALDGRIGNVEEAARRVPGLDVRVGDVEDPALPSLGAADLVLCLGLLYHLENPFRAIRNLAQIAGKVLVLESMCTWDEKPVLHLLEEGPTEDQGLRYIAFYPSESCLIKMLYSAGFSCVYRFTRLPDNADFREQRDRTKQRTMLVGSRHELSSAFLAVAQEPSARFDLWQTAGARMPRPVERAVTFFEKPWSEKVVSLRRFFGVHEPMEPASPVTPAKRS
jgi:SAM-dependent methyltransferase